MLMVFSSRGVGRHELHAHGFGLLGEVVQDALSVALLEVVLRPVGVLLNVGEHGVDQPDQLVGCWTSEFTPRQADPTEEAACALALTPP